MIKMLRFCMIGAYYAGVEGHPQLVMKELGITYVHAVPQSMGDQWWFYIPKNLPQELPSYLTLKDVDPYSHIGFGLSEKNAEILANWKENND